MTNEEILNTVEARFCLALEHQGESTLCSSVLSRSPSLEDYSKMIQGLARRLQIHESTGRLPDMWEKDITIASIIISEVISYAEQK